MRKHKENRIMLTGDSPSSIITELPSYEFLLPDDEHEDPPPPLTPSTTNMADVAVIPPPLIPVRRATAPIFETQLSRESVFEQLSTRPAQLQVSASHNTMMQTTAEGETSENDRQTDLTSVEQVQSSKYVSLYIKAYTSS